MILYRTEAPRAYDGFGTATVYTHERTRLVVIEKEHLRWQLERYASGMYYTEEFPCDKREARDRVLSVIKGRLEDLVEGCDNPREAADDVLALMAHLIGD